jgi:hemoglobin
MPSQLVDAAAIRQAVEIFYARLLDDPGLAYMWRDTDMPRLKAHQRAFVMQALGGPALYSGRDMKAAHEGLGITGEQFERTVGYLLDSLRQVGVADDVIDRASADFESLRALVVEQF